MNKQVKTYQPKKSDIKRNWHFIDAKGEVLGRMASDIAKYLQGKHKTNYSTHMDMGDFVVVVNASNVELTGRKKEQKLYRRHSGYPSGLKEVTFEKMITEHPERVIEKAVSGMLPGNKLKQQRMRRLKVFANDKHPYKDKIKTEIK